MTILTTFDLRRQRATFKVLARTITACLVVTAVAGGTATAQGRYQTQSAAEAQVRELVRQLELETKKALGLAHYCSSFTGPFIAPGVRSAIPNDPDCRTPAEKQYVHKSNGQAILGMQIDAQRAACLAAQAYSPYSTSGRLNPGWHETIMGPRRNACP